MRLDLPYPALSALGFYPQSCAVGDERHVAAFPCNQYSVVPDRGAQSNEGFGVRVPIGVTCTRRYHYQLGRHVAQERLTR